MRINILFYLLLIAIFAGCSQDQPPEAGHENESESIHSGEPDHDHQAEEAPKILLTEYTSNFELFAESDVFIAGEEAGILAHFTWLPSFKPLESGRVTARLVVKGKETSQTQKQPLRPGIYRFELKPSATGQGHLVFDIESKEGSYEIDVPEITVFRDEHAALENNPEHDHAEANTVVFTKEQSWKIDFATAHPSNAPFGSIIRTTAQVQPAPEDKLMVTAKTGGIVSLVSGFIVPGTKVNAGETLFTVSGSGLADNNFAVRYTEARNNYETAKLEYERMQALAEDKIVSETQLLTAKNNYENAMVKFENLQQHFDASGQKVSSPITGFVDEVFVQNGAYIQSGMPVLSVIGDQNLVLHADVRPKFMEMLGSVTSANIRLMPENRIISMEEINANDFAVGKATNTSNYLIPASLMVGRDPALIPGRFVELFLRAESPGPVITVPNGALLEEQGHYFVFVQITPELFEKREIQTGDTDGKNTAILRGLSTEDRIVTRGAMLIKLAQATGTLDAHSGHVH